MTKLSMILPAAVLALGVAAPALADPAVGLGLSINFGHGLSSPQLGIGMRAFSTDKADSTAATIGLDYLPGDNAWRPTVGAAHLFNSSYVGLDMGLTNGSLDFGASGGVQNTLND